jgi:D-arabinose 1-dehydrogenase-like Zn-dependent alcohol dehydrogenase
MQRARLLETGWDREIELDTCDIPVPTGDRVLVQVEACGVCYRDLIDRAGRFRFIQLPITPGHEAVGRVIAVGKGVTEWRLGDRVATTHRDFCGSCPACRAGETSLCTGAAAVFGLLIDGGYATHLVAPERALYAVPPHLPSAEAAILHCTFGTAYRGLVRAGLRAGQRVLVTGANGGVGAAAIQVVQRLRGYPIAVIRNPAQREFVQELGAESVIVDDGTGFHKKLSDPVDIALDCVGEPTFNAALRSLAVGGRIVTIGNVREERVPVNLGYLITRGITILGSSGATRADMQAVLSLCDSLPFIVPIHARLPLERADFAQRVVREGGLSGRVVLEIDRDGPA